MPSPTPGLGEFESLVEFWQRESPYERVKKKINPLRTFKEKILSIEEAPRSQLRRGTGAAGGEELREVESWLSRDLRVGLSPDIKVL
ncbi:hypothetical protein NDU88_005231 [Pleurodeles waltl]|uniref:Uncharacterized protein n=1 Tax=Pleurodeles waltl TaxID=8319 RepID=A0AAV7MX87_PLEWA|nr:hypothetical protein NDU88_005231 [Pleurodeles waltl]